MELPNGQKTRLEKIEQKLYSVDGISSKERPNLKSKIYTTEHDWEEVDQKNETPFKKKKTSVFSIILILAGLFFVGSLAYGGFIFLSGEKNVSVNDVDVKIIGPVSIGGGEQLSLDVIVSNNNSMPLELVDLFVEYPEGSKNSENISEDLRRISLDLGTIPANSATRETVKVALFGEEASYKNINFLLRYRIPGSNAIFEKSKDFEIALNASPIRMITSGLREISAGQEVELTVKFNSNSNQTLKDVIVVGEYPFGFKYAKSNLPPKYDNNIWVFDELKPNQEIELKINGTIEGQNNEVRVFRFNAGLVKEGSPEEIGVLFATNVHQTDISKSFIDVVVKLDENSGVVAVADSNKTINGELVFTNNTNNSIKNVQIQLDFTGSVLDKTSVSAPSGFYSSTNNNIIWNGNSSVLLSNLAPRKTETLSFRFKTIDLKNQNVGFINPQIDLNIKVAGIRIFDSDTEEAISANAFRNIKINSDVVIANYTHYENGPFKNTGPIPPKVNTPTNYTVELGITNNSNDLENAKMTAVVPPYVTWLNNISPSNKNVTFDPVTRQLVWNIGQIEAGAGYAKNMEQLYMQLELLPSASQIGQSVNLLNNLKFTAKDSFTRIDISRDLKSPTTAIKGYPVANKHDSVVQ